MILLNYDMNVSRECYIGMLLAMLHSVYLAGPIDFVEDGVDWRESLIRLEQADMSSSITFVNPYDFSSIRNYPVVEEAVIRSCSAIIANTKDLFRGGFATFIELGMAAALNKPLMLLYDNNDDKLLITDYAEYEFGSWVGKDDFFGHMNDTKQLIQTVINSKSEIWYKEHTQLHKLKLPVEIQSSEERLDSIHALITIGIKIAQRMPIGHVQMSESVSNHPWINTFVKY